MKKIIIASIFGFSVLMGCSVKKEPPASKNEEINAEVRKVIDQLYASIEYKPKKDIQPDWEGMKNLFIDDAIMIAVGDTSISRWTVQEFIDGYRAQIENGVIDMASEYEVYSTGDQYANIAQVFSTYATEGIYNGEENTKRGINSIQLFKMNGTWKVTSIIWYDENADHPIPEPYSK